MNVNRNTDAKQIDFDEVMGMLGYKMPRREPEPQQPTLEELEAKVRMLPMFYGKELEGRNGVG